MLVVAVGSVVGNCPACPGRTLSAAVVAAASEASRFNRMLLLSFVSRGPRAYTGLRQCVDFSQQVGKVHAPR